MAKSPERDVEWVRISYTHRQKVLFYQFYQEFLSVHSARNPLDVIGSPGWSVRLLLVVIHEEMRFRNNSPLRFVEARKAFLAKAGLFLESRSIRLADPFSFHDSKYRVVQI